VNNNPRIKFDVVDYPGNYQFNSNNEDHVSSLMKASSVIYVIGALESIEEQSMRARETIRQILQVNPKCNIEIFIHKIDTDIFRAEDKKIKVMSDVKEIIDERDLA